MGQAAVPTTTDLLKSQLYLLEPLEPMKLPESKHLLGLPEPMKVEELQVTTVPIEMAEDNNGSSEEEELNPLLGTLLGFESEEIPQVRLQLVAQQLMEAESNETQAPFPH